MERSKPRRDQIPERFETIEEFAKFWDKHDTEDYPEVWHEIPVTISMKTRKYPRVVLGGLRKSRLSRDLGH